MFPSRISFVLTNAAWLSRKYDAFGLTLQIRIPSPQTKDKKFVAWPHSLAACGSRNIVPSNLWPNIDVHVGLDGRGFAIATCQMREGPGFIKGSPHLPWQLGIPKWWASVVMNHPTHSGQSASSYDSYESPNTFCIYIKNLYLQMAVAKECSAPQEVRSKPRIFDCLSLRCKWSPSLPIPRLLMCISVPVHVVSKSTSKSEIQNPNIPKCYLGVLGPLNKKATKTIWSPKSKRTVWTLYFGLKILCRQKGAIWCKVFQSCMMYVARSFLYYTRPFSHWCTLRAFSVQLFMISYYVYGLYL